MTSAAKVEKKPCKINLTFEMINLIDDKCKREDKFKEQIFEDAILQLFLPRIGEIGLGHPNFHFIPPLVKSDDVKEEMFWVKINYWTKLKGLKVAEKISMHAIVYTAITNHLNQYRILLEKEKIAIAELDENI